MTLPCQEHRPADESPEGVVIPFPGTYAAAASHPGTGGPLTGDGTPPPAGAPTDEVCAQTAEREQRIRALTERWNALKQARVQSAEREQRIRARTERWNAIEQAPAQAVERELRIRALTERWHALRQARAQSAKRGPLVRARVAAFIAAILRVIDFRADDASFPSRSPYAKRS